MTLITVEITQRFGMCKSKKNPEGIFVHSSSSSTHLQRQFSKEYEDKGKDSSSKIGMERRVGGKERKGTDLSMMSKGVEEKYLERDHF